MSTDAPGLESSFSLATIIILECEVFDITILGESAHQRKGPDSLPRSQRKREFFI